MFSSNAPSVADIAAVTDNNGGWGGNGGAWWIIVILFALFGGWGRGGAFGGNGGCGCDGACATVGDVERGFNNQSTQQRFNGIDQGLCQLGYDNLAQTSNLQNTVMQGNFALQQAINNAAVASMQDTNSLSRQLADCCCDLTNTMNANTRAITDQLNAFRMEDKNETIAELRSQVQALNLAASQQNQNRYLIDTLRPCPVPAYQTCNPWGANGYGGFGYGSCCNSGCGC